MMRSLSGWTVLLLLAVLFVVGLLVARRQQPAIDDPVGDAVKQISEAVGMDVDPNAMGGEGVAVLAVRPGSPAERVGLRKGDLIRAAGDRTVWHAKSLYDRMAEGMQRGGLSLLVEHGGVFRQVIFGGAARGAGGAGRAGGPGGTQRPGPGPSRGGTVPGRPPGG